MQGLAKLEGLAHSVSAYEDPERLDRALAVLPLERLFAEAEAQAPASAYGEEDLVVVALLKWFKQWFAWTNSAPCAACGNEKTTSVGAAEPTAEERQFGAGVTELWQCECGAVTRFPRYNDAIKLLETRSGRCGEWCNVMTLLLRALGRDVRYVWNSEDHVWNEVWSEARQRWIHVDSCEAAFDTPLVYVDGWGKHMAYVLAFSVGGARDVTARYVRRRDAALPRTLWPEPVLRGSLELLTARARQALAPEDEVTWFERDEAEDRELQGVGTTSTQELQPRQSGSEAWTKARGEGGRS